MQTYICLLRSINVSGTNIIKMAELRSFWENLGFSEVKTYIQSGNIIFKSTSKPDVSVLEKAIEIQFQTKNVSVIIKTPAQLETIIRQNPFLSLKDFDPKKMYISYFQEIPDTSKQKDFEQLQFGEDQFKIIDDVLYIYFGISAGKTKLTNKIIEGKLGISATTRNWNTTNKLFSLVS
ncbi:Uncharacterized conserved protein, DUF1697 family [Pustulibacterium marinum]|uniref:Uncharacterized conserved protein, DUF1697 family n=1 Tax=Pustulibacterium marinum TaxID=1224947 RepID=A0A1I7G2Q0_9FLAO|nr:DUF1697 domain-containing protein [Pustulibacterium marinum]SFU42718.1 Uncharacterized conserved protein, DUF1697 family [Pustulibacterium marinum]